MGLRTKSIYDECTFNKIVDGEQLTVQFHVDDLKTSHMDQAVLDKLMCDLNIVFEEQKPLAETQGTIHEYLSMTIDYSKKGKVKFTTSLFTVGCILCESLESLLLCICISFKFRCYAG